MGIALKMCRATFAVLPILTEGLEVGLEFDEERRDKYRRLLAYVWLPDGSMLNRMLVHNHIDVEGGRKVPGPPFTHKVER